MDRGKKAIVIGAGIGGITTAGILARRGYKVTLFEKNNFFGGRCGSFTREGHRFDTGATFLMMPGVFEEMFAALGKSMHEELNLVRMDPVYSLRFASGQRVDFTSDLYKLQTQFEAIEPGSYEKFLQLMAKGFRTYKDSMKLIHRNYPGILDPYLLTVPLKMIRFKAFNDHYRYISRFFKSDELRALFTFQNLYMGQDPLHASGIYHQLPFMELSDGVFFPGGGMSRVSEKLLDAAMELGVKAVAGAPVERIETGRGRVEGVVLKDGSTHKADLVVANADLPYVYRELLPAGRKSRRLENLKYSCSAVVLHWAMDKVYPQLGHHTVFVSGKQREASNRIFCEHGVADEPSIYIHSPARTDPTAAPEGRDSITAIVHTGHMTASGPDDWTTMKEQSRKAIIKRLNEEGMDDFEEHILFESAYTPQHWHSVLNLTNGSTFGSVGHNILQMGPLRPSNRHAKFKNLFFVGGSTVPGSGVPLALSSARLVTERISRNKNLS